MTLRVVDGCNPKRCIVTLLAPKHAVAVCDTPVRVIGAATVTVVEPVTAFVQPCAV